MAAPARAHRQVLGRFLVAVQNLPTSGTNVFEDTVYAIAQGSVPAVAVEPDDETSEEFAPALDSFDDTDEDVRRLGVFVTAIGSTPAERDAIMLEAEEAVIAASIGRSCNFISAKFERSGEGAKPVYAVRSRFVTTYHVEAVRPDQIIRGKESA